MPKNYSEFLKLISDWNQTEGLTHKNEEESTTKTTTTIKTSRRKRRGEEEEKEAEGEDSECVNPAVSYSKYRH